MAGENTRQSRSAPLTRLNIKRHEQMAFTIAAICASPIVNEYLIGYTSRQGIRRADEYRRMGYEYFVILADRLTMDEAHWLEEILQSHIVFNKQMSIYKKYDKSRREGPYRRSSGGIIDHATKPIHSVYMAWK